MYKNILIPVLIDDEHANTAPAFAVARALAAEGAAFTVLHVSEAIPGFVSAEIPQNILDNRRDEAAQAVADMAKALPNATAKIVVGHAGSTLVDYAKDHDIDCIVIASHKPGLQNFFLGSTASRVVRHAHCAVHVVR